MPKAFRSALVLGKITSCNLEMKDRKFVHEEYQKEIMEVKACATEGKL